MNGQLANLVARLGKEEAPQVAAFYCGLNGRRYVQGGHSVGLLLHDAEKLRTTWATGSTGDTTTDVFSKLIRDAEEGERHEGDE